MSTLVTGIFKEPADAARAVEALARAGIPRDEINVLASDKAKMEAFGIKTRSKASEGAAIGGTVGATLGAVIAGFTAVGALATGGAGLLIAGPIVAILAGAGAGAAAGGLVGALIGLGIPKHLVEYYTDALDKGSVLIGVKVDRDRADAIREILKNHGAETPTTESAPGPASAAGAFAARGSTSAVACPTGASMFSEKANTLHALFLEQLKDIYYAEKQLVTALPTMRDKASDRNLAAAFAEHLDETVRHVTRLEEVFSSIGLKPEEHKCPAINGIIAEAKELMGMDGTPAERDAALICAAQKAEHYEMATYGCLRAYARTLGLDAASSLLAQTLHEEQAADRKLTELAESGINADAAKHGGGLVGSTRTYRPE